MIVTKKQECLWLDSSIDEKMIKEIMRLYDTNDMVTHPVENKVHGIGYNTNDKCVIEAFNYPDLHALDF